MNAYLNAKNEYSKFGVDTDEALKKLKDVSISIHCWQGDDVVGFENLDGELSGGIMSTGNYPGRAQNPEQLMQDIDKVLSLVPGKKHRLNLHAIYRITEENPDRSELKPEHFTKWVEFAKARGLKLDFNPTLFSHEMVKDGLTLSSPDEKVRQYWIKHCKSCRKIGEYFGRELDSACLINIWIPDGLKDIPADRISPRRRLKESLDEIYSEKIDSKFVIDSLESKLFGIGAEAYTVGSHEFYMSYAAKNNKLCLLDSGHFHLTESIADKMSSMLLFNEKLALHISRPIRWDSDHVISFNDDVKDMANEIVRCDALDRVIIGLDYFDASINRIAAWAIGVRNVQKALLSALLTPHNQLKGYQESANFTDLLAVGEEVKMLPLGDVWEQFCLENNVAGRDYLNVIKAYEKEVLVKR